MQNVSGVRRNIQTLQENDRKQYFWCLKMLSILPPFQENKKRYFFSLGVTGPDWPSHNPYNKIVPMCLYDELIASHATSCEHGSFYFAYYHRHLMAYFQMLLNYVDEVLRADGEDKFQTKFHFLYNHSNNSLHALWDTYLAQYRALPQKKVMAHYWNPTNYNNRNDLIIPIEVSDPKIYGYQYDNLDHIFNAVRGHYPHQVNVQKRWYRTNYNKQEFVKKMTDEFPYFYGGYEFTVDEKDMLNGKINPRNQDFNKFFETYKSFANIVSDKELVSSMKATSSRNLQMFNSTGKMNLFFQYEHQALVNFGSRVDKDNNAVQMQYLQQSELDQTDVTKRVDQINYNSMKPHYILAYALFNRDFYYFKDYINPGSVNSRRNLERSHNVMHNNMHFSMIDSNFSLCNMAFFPYHSWIDVQLQMKIRMCQTPLQASKLQAELNKETYFEDGSLLDFVIGAGPGHRKGDYPILEWCDPLYVSYIKWSNKTAQQKQQLTRQFDIIRSLHIAFKAQDFYLQKTENGNKIRSCTDLGEFYANNYMNQYNIKRLAEFKGFQEYNVSYDIEIFETIYDQATNRPVNIQRPLGLLEDNTLYIPQYLLAMKNQVNTEITYFENFIDAYKKSNTSAKLQPRSVKYYLKLIQTTLLLHVRYSTLLPNGNYFIEASFKELQNLLKKKHYQVPASSYGFNALPKKEIIVSTLSVFGKANHSKLCLKCGSQKNVLVNIGQELFQRHKFLWGLINLCITRELIYDSTQPDKYITQDNEVDLSNVLAVKNACSSFSFDYIQGTEQALFDVQFISYNQQDIINVQGEEQRLLPKDFQLTIQLKIKSSQTSKPTSVASKEFEFVDLKKDSAKVGTFDCNFDFYNLRQNSPTLKSGELDGLIYSDVTVNIFANNKLLYFSFPIKHYHELIRYKIVIVSNKVSQKLQAKVYDADFDFKQKLFLKANLYGK